MVPTIEAVKSKLDQPMVLGYSNVGRVLDAGDKLSVTGYQEADRVVSNGGLHGVITGLTDEIVTMEIAPKVRVKVSRGSVAGVSRKDGN